MRKRWQVLSAIASFGVMGFLAVVAQRNFQPNLWVFAGLGGFAVACAVALWAAIKDHRGKWPAAIALLAFAPFAQRLVEYFAADTRSMRYMLFLDLQIVLCSILTVIAAVVILILPVPPPDDPIPPARQV